VTRSEAEQQGYCEHCAAYVNGIQLCGHLALNGDKNLCKLPADVRERWRREFGTDQKGRLK
jgi:hypothetical protein